MRLRSRGRESRRARSDRSVLDAGDAPSGTFSFARRARKEAADPLGSEGVDRVRAILFLGGVPADSLDDGVQQVRLKLLERAAKPNPPLTNPKAWISVVASNVAADWHRSTKRDRGLVERIASRASPASQASHPQEQTTLAAAIGAGLDELPEQQRQLLVLRFYEDLSVREIAAHLGVAEGTVKSRLHHAVKAIRTRLQALEVI